MTTATVLVKGSMRSLSLLKKGVTPDADELADGHELLNQMLSLWSTDGLFVPYRTNETLAFPSSAISYTIGSGADLNTARPLSIENAVILSGSTPYPLSPQSLQMIRAFNPSIGGIPQYYYYEPTYTTGTLTFDVKPSTGLTIKLDSLKELTQFAAVTTNIDMPPGYDFALRFNLAVFMAAEYGKQIPAGVAKAAEDGMNMIRSAASRNREIFSRVDNALTARRGHYKVLSDQGA